MTVLQVAVAIGAIVIVIVFWRVFAVVAAQHAQTRGSRHPIDPDETGISDECWSNLQW